MRAPARLRSRAKGNREFRDAAAVANGVLMALSERQEGDPSGFSPTSGYASTELASGRWMPHDHRPIVGFTPNGANR